MSIISRGLRILAGFCPSGIIPRATLESNGAAVNYNDPYRYDDCTDAESCFSIGFPNYKMFWGLRKDNPGKEWVVIACKPDILWLKDCVFCYENAASDTVTSIPLKDRKGVDAFERLFSPAEGKPSRKELVSQITYLQIPKPRCLYSASLNQNI